MTKNELKKEIEEIERKYNLAIETNRNFQRKLHETTKMMERLQMEQAIENIKKELQLLLSFLQD